MSSFVHLEPAEAAARVQAELDGARENLDGGRLEVALDGYVRALGLGLQLGPAPTEAVLSAVLGAARDLAGRDEGVVLSALGPSLVDLVERVTATSALPNTPVMLAWAAIAADLGALIGQVGLALSIPAQHRTAMLEIAKARASALDNATDGRFASAAWIAELISQVS